MAFVYNQHHESILVLIWNHLKIINATELSSLPPIDTTLLLMRDWTQKQFSAHPQVDEALQALKMPDSTP